MNIEGERAGYKLNSTFLQSSKNLPNNITEQVKALNNLVLGYAVPQVLGKAIGYVKYKKMMPV